ncbi:MAG TPA: carbohydrate ABC transporter permease [Candidatus Scybalocola faecigallinarum]|uniref:Carbohydrate ABC transporter permease n=1 Tax=Candidatus Scybalocola faecigallinarum TaxID=2840941 RepID=A0A9D1JQA4_9FIRM|nr:carbohydrate ABC transporter permease [Candidatus Scybalocola faecigallinarum]
MKDKPFSLYQIVSNAVMIIWTICIILPFLLLFMSSITSESVLVAEGYSFWPKVFSLESYAYIIKSGGQILRAYGVSILVTVVGTIVHVALAAMMAYPLAVKNLPGRRILMFFVFFTMLFNGGIVPSYIMWSNTFHIKDTILAQLLPNLLLSAWNVMMIRTYFSTSIPDALYEAAEIDGATQFRIFRTIVVPLGKPILVTMGTFAGLGYWNDWTNGLYYITRNTEYYNIQNLLNQMVQNIQFLAQSSDANMAAAAAAIPTTGIQMAIAFVAILPIMLIFPFFQKYYSKGIALGAVKG